MSDFGPKDLEPSTLIEMLRRRASTTPDTTGYTFLVDGETDESPMTYEELDRRARAIGALLQGIGAQGERILLLYPPGLDYIAAFFGCLYAGAIAVPAYPPQPSQMARTLPRLAAIIESSRAKAALTTSAIVEFAQPVFAEHAALRDVFWLATDELEAGREVDWRQPAITSESLAFLQYTSGSTGNPKGVMLTHGNLLHNVSRIGEMLGEATRHPAVSWLPPYHDMGLIGSIIAPAYANFPMILMAPAAFLQRPLRWLSAISRYRAGTTPAPNFAYELCVRKVKPEDKAALDLSCWMVALNGAEPVRQETLERFTQAFAACGFRATTHRPVYGLAEGTVFTSGPLHARPPKAILVDRDALAQGRIAPAPAPDRGQSLVACGPTIGGQRIVIAHPDELRPCGLSEVGEVWVHGPSVAKGYWEMPDESQRTFGARLKGSTEGPFMRTGDLGFVDAEGDLFITGRLKDLIIIRGKNHYPQDIERTLERSSPALRAGCSVAFSVDVGGTEQLALVAEVDRTFLSGGGATPAGLEDVIGTIRQTVGTEHELQVHAVVLLKPGQLFKTSSGKVQRRATKAAFLAGSLEPIAQWRGSTEEAPRGAAKPADPLELKSVRDLVTLLVRELSHRLGISEAEIDPRQPFTRYGLDSLAAVELSSDMEAQLKVELPAVNLLDLSIEALAKQLFEQLSGGATPKPKMDPLERVPRDRPLPLSFVQERFWQFHKMGLGHVINEPLTLRFTGRLDLAVLTRALDEVVRRHESLRTSFPAVDGRPVQMVQPPPAHTIPVVDLSDVPGGERAAAAARLAEEETARPLDLERVPVFRVKALRHSPALHDVHFVLNHILTDGKSLGLFIKELVTLYGAFAAGRKSPLPELPVQFADFAVWQQQWLTPAKLTPLLDHWRKELAGIPEAALELPADHPRSPMPTFRSASAPVRVSNMVYDELRALGKREGATLSMTLSAAVNALLYRLTGKEDILVGSIVANREKAELDTLIGSFAHIVPIRLRVSGDESFTELLARARKTMLAMYANQALQFGQVMGHLMPDRHPAMRPLFRGLWNLQALQLPTKMGELKLEVVKHPHTPALFDWAFMMFEASSGLRGNFDYNPDLFEPATIARFVDEFEGLLAAIVARPDAKVRELPLNAARQK